jgi:hypothetical protein
MDLPARTHGIVDNSVSKGYTAPHGDRAQRPGSVSMTAPITLLEDVAAVVKATRITVKRLRTPILPRPKAVGCMPW